MNLKVNEWNESYNRQENFIFYPKEEVVKFLNRFIKKRIGLNAFKNLLMAEPGKQLVGLDLGCGIGRNTVLFEEFGIEGHGLDISSEAISVAKELSKAMGYEIAERFKVIQEVAIPFPDKFFDFAVSDSVLDSMEFKFAKTYLKELDRTVKRYVYLNLVSTEGSEAQTKESLVSGKHEFGTIQSYFDLPKIEDLISGTDFKIVQLFKTTQEDEVNKQKLFARFHIVLSK